MTHKLFYEDPYLQSFSAKVIKQQQDENQNTYVILDKTAFYPTGGGQPFDTGVLGDRKVMNVEEVDSEVRHYLDAPLLEVNERTEGTIDWIRRFDHMQQHAGQHILSAAFEELFGFATVGFHLGKEILTIDLDTQNLSEEQARNAELLANQIILENRPIETKWITSEEISNYPLRKKLSVTEDIRLVIIDSFDYNGCGGTHPKSTGEVIAIKILNWEKQKKKTRLQFVCGKRVLMMLHEKHEILKQLTGLLNSPEAGMKEAVVRILESNKVLEKSLDEAKDTILKYEVKDLIEFEQDDIVFKVYKNRSMQELQKMARMLVAESPNIFCLLVSENAGDMLQFIFARGANRETNMKKVAADALAVMNGKGGGTESFAQGGGVASISGEDLIQFVINKNS